jgi:hypothetical protein
VQQLVATPTNFEMRGSPGDLNVDTYRQLHTAQFATESVRLVYANHYGSSGVGGVANTNDILVKAAVEEVSSSGVKVQDGTRHPAYFGTERTVTIAGGALAVSEPISVSLAAGQQFFVRTGVSVGTAAHFIPTSAESTLRGGTNIGALDNGEGFRNNVDTVDEGVTLDAAVSAPYAPAAVLGTPAADVPSLILLGPSLMAGATSFGVQAARDLGFGQITTAKSSEMIPAFLTNNTAYRLAFGGYCTHALIMQVETTGFVLSTTKTGYLALADAVMTANPHLERLVFATLPPFGNTSTDGFRTASGQTVHSSNTNRQLVNAWMRDSAQFASDMAPHSVAVVDCAAAIEVDADNALGPYGRWLAPASSYATGTATSAAATSITDTTKSWARQELAGKLMRITGGTGVGQVRQITINHATQFGWSGGLSPAPDTTSVYEVYDASTSDGTHQSGYGHSLMAAVIEESDFPFAGGLTVPMLSVQQVATTIVLNWT